MRRVAEGFLYGASIVCGLVLTIGGGFLLVCVMPIVLIRLIAGAPPDGVMAGVVGVVYFILLFGLGGIVAEFWPGEEDGDA